MPALSDPSTVHAFKASDSRIAYVTALANQIKIHLLTAEHVVLSHGFLYDNPGLWDLFEVPCFSDLLLSPVGARAHSSLLVQVDPGEQREATHLFQRWAFGKSVDERRVLEPSALRCDWSLREKPEAGPAALAKLPRDQTDLETYAKALGLDELLDAAPKIESVLDQATLLEKPTNRYRTFTSDLIRFADSPESVFPGVRDLRQAVDQLTNRGTKAISRGLLERHHPDVFRRFLPQINFFRQRGYLEPFEFAATNPAPYNPVRCSQGNVRRGAKGTQELNLVPRA